MAHDFSDIHGRSRPGRAFPNGGSFARWSTQWCDRCLVDAPWRNGLKGAVGCPLIAVALVDRTPSEWLPQPAGAADEYHCTEFRPPGSRNAEPHPVPTPRDQGVLFGRGVHAGRRVLRSIEPASGASGIDPDVAMARTGEATHGG